MNLVINNPFEKSDIKSLIKKVEGMAASAGLYDDRVKSKDALALRDVLTLLTAIDQGIELPKGYGNLVDFDKLCDEYWDGDSMRISRGDLQNISPIIPADTEGEEEVKETEDLDR